jgi:hypothetical protein
MSGDATFVESTVAANGPIEIWPPTIRVDNQPSLPVASRLKNDPESVVQLGDLFELSWEVNGNPARVQIVRDQSVLWANAPEPGSVQDCPPQAGTVVYGVPASAPVTRPRPNGSSR